VDRCCLYLKKQNFMSGFTPFKKHANKFNYLPRYYDPEKEERDRRRAERRGERAGPADTGQTLADVVVGLARFERPDMVVEPLHEGHIVGIASLERHGHVAMGIH